MYLSTLGTTQSYFEGTLTFIYSIKGSVFHWMDWIQAHSIVALGRPACDEIRIFNMDAHISIRPYS